ncbi:MAG: hypothetical protein FJ024_10370 [Chloroflexi bacterium]|nr:hypothetical protein [Chloroflexota bacterium]
MEQLVAVLRWHPLGPSAGPFAPIRKTDLDKLASQHNVNISVEEVVGKNRQEVDGMLREETMDSTIEEISQTVVTVATDNENAFRKAIRALIDKYGAPRTTFGAWGSTEKARQIVVELCDEDDGWS